MKVRESDLRKWHRRLGITLALFIIFQAGSGLLISLREIGEPHNHAHSETAVTAHSNYENASLWDKFQGFVHHGGGEIGSAYRIIFAGGLLGMAVSGSMIFFRIRARTKKA